MKYLENLCRYIKFDRKNGKVRKDFVTALGFGVDYSDPDEAYRQMLLTRRYFGKESRNPLVHFVFAFDTKVKTEKEAVDLSIRIAEYYQDRYQLLWGIHKKHDKVENVMRYHMHLIINSVSYIDGKMISTWLTEIEYFRMYIQSVTNSLVQFYFAGYKDDV